MESYPKSNWLGSLSKGSHACFFYTTTEEFFSIAIPFLNEGVEGARERCLWILPPNTSFAKGKKDLQERLSLNIELLLKRRRLILIPWDKWYDMELPINQLLKRSQLFLKEALNDGFDGVRILGHSPHRTSPYWKDFFLYEEALSKKVGRKLSLSLCGYSLIDCPAAAISSIALNHTLCLIPRGSEWEWLEKKLPSGPFHYRHPAG